jgi:hypothetical protein
MSIESGYEADPLTNTSDRKYDFKWEYMPERNEALLDIQQQNT